MNNPDLIAYLIPQNEAAIIAVRMPENGRLHDYIEHSLFPDGRVTHPNLLRLSFNTSRKSGLGFVFGTNQDTCDIFLLNSNGNISEQHCYLTFNEERRLVLKDQSTHGSQVLYNEQGKAFRKNFNWILSGNLPVFAPIITLYIQSVAFYIVVAEHHLSSTSYIPKIDNFLLQGEAYVRLPNNGFGLVDSTLQNPIHIFEKKLGSGTFSDVYQVWDVRDGRRYALKEMKHLASGWKREAYIMTKTKHENIVTCFRSYATPSPHLILEYVPNGNLQQYYYKYGVTYLQNLDIICQSLEALTFLHDKNIVHRDIKPENILIQSRDPLHIKLGDFGLSKATLELNTQCGTPRYLAPEISQGTRGYTNRVDIWSLGIVISDLAFHFPRPWNGGLYNTFWHTQVGTQLAVDRQQGLNQGLPFGPVLRELGSLIHDTMLVYDPTKRCSAGYCLEQASLLRDKSARRNNRNREPAATRLQEEGDRASALTMRPKPSQAAPLTEIWNPLKPGSPPIIDLRSSGPSTPKPQAAGSGSQAQNIQEAIGSSHKHVPNQVDDHEHGPIQVDNENNANLEPNPSETSPGPEELQKFRQNLGPMPLGTWEEAEKILKARGHLEYY